MPNVKLSAKAEKEKRDIAKLSSIKISTETTADRGSAESGAKLVLNGDTTTHAGSWYAIQGINSAVVDLSDCTFDSNMDGFTGTTDITIPDGTTIFVNATVLSLVSGTAIFYKK